MFYDVRGGFRHYYEFDTYLSPIMPHYLRTTTSTDDFAAGTLVIKEPNSVYKLCENISFRPFGPAAVAYGAAADELPAENAFNPQSFDELYTENGYGMGFFSAIAIAAPGVTIHLNGYTIEQSAEHALMQRFFAGKHIKVY